MTSTVNVPDWRRALADAAPRAYWTDRPDERPTPAEPLHGSRTADLVVVGGGLTGLWAAVEAKRRDPGTDVVLLEAQTVGFGASGRNGGFISESLTHGLAHGVSMWPEETPTLLRLGKQNLDEIDELLREEGIEADLQRVGKTMVATRPHEVGLLEESLRLHRQYDEPAELLDRDEMRADVASPTYLAGLRTRTGGGLVDPARLCWGLRDLAGRLGVTVHERSAVLGLDHDGSAVTVRTDAGRVRADRVLLATSAYPVPLRRLRNWVLPVYDHVLATEPLPAAVLAEIGWRERQGLTDSGNQFHYYRLTADNRVLWGGYHAVYHFGGRIDPALEQRDATHELLARQLLETFPQLEGIRFTHRWAGVIDSTSRFTPLFGTALSGKVAYAVGYTGLGVGASRFGAQVGLDLLAGLDTERTRLQMVRKRPMPFPPEPARWLTVQATRAALIRQDANGGRRGPWLRLLDRFGVGFDS